MPTSPITISTLPTPPSTTSPSDFDSRADAFLLALPTLSDQINSVATTTYENSVESKTSADSAAAYTNATRWTSGTSYVLGAVVYSPTNYNLYRKITSTSSSTIDPGGATGDTVRWLNINPISTSTDAFNIGNGQFYKSNTGFVGLNTITPGARLDVKGTLRLSGSTSGYVGIAPAAAAGSVTYTLPSTDGTAGAVLTTNGTATLSWANAAGIPGANNVGYLNIPQNIQSVTYNLALSDSGKHILHPSSDTTARTYTILANSSVAYPIGTALTFVNQNGAGTLTIAISIDTMRLAGTSLTGSRTLLANGIATALKITSTEWIISGVNLT